MNISFNLLIIVILLICLWFYYNCKKVKSASRSKFIQLIIFAIIMYVNRLWGIAMDEGVFPSSDKLYIVQKIIHYLMTGSIYSFYAYFMGTLMYQYKYMAFWKKFIFWIPNIILDICIIISPVTGILFYYENGQFFRGKLFWIMIAIRGAYALHATFVALSKRRLLPGVFAKSVVLVAFITASEFIFFALTMDETLYYTAILLDIIIMVLTLTVVEFYRDMVTELLNKEAFEQYINKEMDGRKNQAVYLIKLKNFNYLKNNCNELALVGAIKELAVCIKAYSLLASIYYLGEGKYTIIIPKKTKFNEQEFVEKLEQRFCKPFDVNGASISLSLFVAIIHLNNDKVNKTNFWKFFSACDNIKYKSNELVEVIYGDSFGVDQLQRYKDVEEAIERALVEKEFKMFYQPIISATTKKVVSCEALIRLYDRILGFISPEEFIPISEGNGKILEISDFVIETVFKFISENDLPSLGIEFVEMNLSMIQCMDANLPDKLLYYSEKYNVKPEFVNLEITETATNIDEDSLKRQLFEIKKLGFAFSLDDYGTGYSNLVRVLEYPVDIIKLDKSIIWSAFHNKDNYLTVKNLIIMFHDVRRKLVAEGVENQEQLQKLIELGCDLIQGYFYSKPIPEADFLNYVSKFNND